MVGEDRSIRVEYGSGSGENKGRTELRHRLKYPSCDSQLMRWHERMTYILYTLNSGSAPITAMPNAGKQRLRYGLLIRSKLRRKKPMVYAHAAVYLNNFFDTLCTIKPAMIFATSPLTHRGRRCKAVPRAHPRNTPWKYIAVKKNPCDEEGDNVSRLPAGCGS